MNKWLLESNFINKPNTRRFDKCIIIRYFVDNYLHFQDSDWRSTPIRKSVLEIYLFEITATIIINYIQQNYTRLT